MSAAQLAVRNKAVEGTIELSRYSFDDRPVNINTYRWGTSDKKILVLHGWADTGLSFGNLIEELVTAGYSVIAYDAPAHGASTVKRTTLVQWLHILDQFLLSEGGIYGIVGHSIGALNAALTLSRKNHHVEKLVLVSPPLSAPAFFKDTFEIFGIRPKVAAHVYSLIRNRLQQDLQELDLHLYMNRIRAGEILLIYDEADQLIKHTEITAYIQQYNAPLAVSVGVEDDRASGVPIRSFKINGKGHFRIMKNVAVIERILAFLA